MREPMASSQARAADSTMASVMQVSVMSYIFASSPESRFHTSR
mgnify:CR=1 FL=1